MNNKCLNNERLSLLLFILSWTTYAIVFMTKNCYSAAMATIVSEGIFTKSQTGVINALFFLLYAPLQIVGGVAADRYSPAKLIIVGLIGASIANFVICVSQNYILMLITWSCNAVIQFGIWPSIFKIVSSQLAQVHRKKAVFLITMAASFGLVLSYIIASIIKHWQSNFLISAWLLFIFAVVWIISYGFFEKKMVLETYDNPIDGLVKPQKSRDTIRLFFTSGLVLLFIVAIIRGMLDWAIKSLTPVMISESYNNISPSLASGLNVIIIVSGVLGLFIEKLLYPKYIHDEASAITVLIFVLLPFVFVATLIGKLSPIWIIVTLAVIIAFLAASGQFTTLYIAVRFNKIGKAATVAGVFNAMACIGNVLASFGITLLADTFGWLYTIYAWFASAVVALILSIIAIPLWRKYICT